MFLGNVFLSVLKSEKNILLFYGQCTFENGLTSQLGFLFKVNNGSARTICVFCSKLTVSTPD